MDKNEIRLQTYGKYSEQPKKTTLLFKTELGIMENPFTKPRPGFTVLYINKGLCFNKAYRETLAEESQKYGQVN